MLNANKCLKIIAILIKTWVPDQKTTTTKMFVFFLVFFLSYVFFSRFSLLLPSAIKAKQFAGSRSLFSPQIHSGGGTAKRAKRTKLFVYHLVELVSIKNY